MEEAEYAGDDRAFRINFAGEGAAKLQETVREKLREFLGDYTDDTLVEYVIVLLKNGRLKEEAKRELNVFLGDESDSFVSWLWDHLSLNMHTYVQPIEPLTEEAANRTTTANAHFGKLNSEVEPVVVFEHDDEKSVNASRSRRNREWKGIVSEMSGSFPLRSTVIEALHSGEKTSQRSDASHKPQVSKKRNREDERQPAKGDAESLPKLAPPRRLLEFALRDAVKTVQQSSSKIEPVVKRLRSVVSTSMEALLDERSQRPRSTIRTPSSTSVALKAAAEAAEDVTKSSSVGSVFDRLGRSQPTVEPMNSSSYMKRTFLQDAKDEKFDQIIRPVQVDYSQKNDYGGDLTGNSSILNSVADIDADSTSDNDGYDDFGISSDHGLDASEYAYSANKRESSLMLHYNVSKDTDAVVNKTKLIQQETLPNALAKPSNKIVNISVNVNTWKPDDYQVVETGNQTTLKPNVRVLKDNPSSIVGNEKEMASTDIQKDSQKSQVQVSTLGISYTTSRPSEDVESRTIFVSNVHFAATKDTLSRHFNKFGEVLKVIIVTDPASGQPIGSAYVEFLRKESAELALSLNGTSFMSRILKVVRRSSAEAHAIGWARNGRPPSFATRLSRMAFPRGVIPGAGSGGSFRARLALKHGARSLQWKRGAAAPQTSGVTLQNAVPATPRIAGRNLTYVRPDKALENL